jgi:hypothetical protein
MKFKTACTVGAWLAGPFGLAFVVLPEQISSLYGIAGWNPGTSLVGRLYGIGLLYAASAAFAGRNSDDAWYQFGLCSSNGLVSVLGGALCLHAVLTAAANGLMWSTVVLFGALAAMWWSARPRK